MSDFYVMDETGVVRQVAECTEWAKWFETAKRSIREDVLPDGTRISTVFLGIDHNFFPGGRPLLFETMIFGGPHHHYQDRYSTRDEAIAGHLIAVKIAGLIA